MRFVQSAPWILENRQGQHLICRFARTRAYNVEPMASGVAAQGVSVPERARGSCDVAPDVMDPTSVDRVPYLGTYASQEPVQLHRMPDCEFDSQQACDQSHFPVL